MENVHRAHSPKAHETNPFVKAFNGIGSPHRLSRRGGSAFGTSLETSRSRCHLPFFVSRFGPHAAEPNCFPSWPRRNT